MMISDDHPEGRPIFSGAAMRFKDGTELFLNAQDAEQPLDIFDHESHDVIWAELDRKVRHYYGPPFFPVLTYVPKALA